MNYDILSGTLSKHKRWMPWGYSILNPHTHVENLLQVYTGECDFQMDWQIKQPHLKFTPPLYNILVKSITEGVHIWCGSV